MNRPNASRKTSDERVVTAGDHRASANVSSARSGWRGFSLVLLILLATATFAEAAHPLRLTDYSEQSRVELEIAGGKMKNPLPATFMHYLLTVDANVHANTHLWLGIPFSGYEGVAGTDNMIRGNLLLGAGYRLSITDWVCLGFGLRLYLPTYERAAPTFLGLDRDPLRALMSHWHYRFQYALSDRFPVSPEMMVRFEKAGFFAQLEGAFTWAPEIRERTDAVREKHVLLFQWGAGLGYDVLGYVELNASVTGLLDADGEAKNLAEILGVPVRAPRTLHALSVGPRAQYKWFVFRFEAAIPLESEFRERLDPWYTGAVQVQFP